MGCAPLLGAGNLSAPAGAQCGGLQLRPWCAVQLVTADFHLPTIEQFAGRAPLGWLQGRQLVHMCHVGTCCPLLLPGLWLQCLPGRACSRAGRWTSCKRSGQSQGDALTGLLPLLPALPWPVLRRPNPPACRRPAHWGLLQMQRGPRRSPLLQLSQLGLQLLRPGPCACAASGPGHLLALEHPPPCVSLQGKAPKLCVCAAWLIGKHAVWL